MTGQSPPQIAFGYGSPRWSGEILDCSMPMTFDQYSNCSFLCAYCFAQFQRGIGKSKKAYVAKQVKAVDPRRFRRIFLGEVKSQFLPYIQERKTMQWGGLSDPFCNYERQYGVGLEILRFLREIDYPVCFSTKATWWTEDERYAELFRGNKKWNVKVSIITLDPAKMHAFEPNLPTSEDRLAAIGRIAKWDGGGATLRLRPFIVGVANPTHVDLIRRAGEVGATAMSTEFFCLEVRSKSLRTKLRELNKVAGMDVYEFYRQNSAQAGYLRLNRKVKKPFIDEMREAAHAVGMRFYVSDAHFKELCDNGSCCGLSPDWNYSRGQFTEALLLCKKNGRVTWPEVAAHLKFLGSIQWDRAEGLNTNSMETRATYAGHTLVDFMRNTWNNPFAGQSPYRMFGGVMKPIGKDENGDLIYGYDPTKESGSWTGRGD